MSAIPHLQKQLKEMTTKPPAGFRVEVGDDLFLWTVWFHGPAGTPYYPATYRAQLWFPSDFPMKPPDFKILSTFWHPNVYPDGRVCISILHPPGEDELNQGETAMMRWTPVQSIASVLISVISLLSDPDSQDAGAPANVEALVQYRKDREGFIAKCQQLAAKATNELPSGFVPIPTEESKPHVAQERGMSFLADEFTAVVEDDVPDHPFRAELLSLRDMGVGADRSDDELLQLLTKCKGDISSVMERLE